MEKLQYRWLQTLDKIFPNPIIDWLIDSFIHRSLDRIQWWSISVQETPSLKQKRRKRSSAISSV